MFDLPPLNFCTSPPLEALKPHRSHSTTHILMHHHQTERHQKKPTITTIAAGGLQAEDTENIMMMSCTSDIGGAGTAAIVAPGDKNQSTNRRLSGPILNSSAKQHLYVSNNCNAGFKPAAILRRSFRTDPMMTNNHNNNERWSVAGDEGTGAAGGGGGDDGDSEVERFNFEGIQISYSSPSLPAMDGSSDSPPAAKLFHCEASVSPKRRPLKHHNHNQRLQRLQRPCLDFDKMQQVSGRRGEEANSYR